MEKSINSTCSNKLTVIDFFCGAGGFSEGFRQQGFEIIKGIDNWSPAVKTFNHNFGLNGMPQDILEYWDNVELIESLPDSDIIIGSPPCISFSNSNRSGKADKSLGLKLTEVFLRIIAVKKHKKGSILSAWFMENVTNSLNYLARSYKFRDLNLYEWAKENGYSPDKVVITIEGNSSIINSAEYGSAQARKRAITGEFVNDEKFIIPPKTHCLNKENTSIPFTKTLGLVKKLLPKPNCRKSSRSIEDPLYPGLRIPLDKLTDHFYDSGLYQCQWKNSYFMKRNHPYMGRMSFPENENKPSRTVTATNIGTSREAIIYKSEYNRIGDGEYRVPTVREMSSLMGFPITYQFLGGSESSKCRLVGNAVCPSVSSALAKMTRQQLGLNEINNPIIVTNNDLRDVINLNTYAEKIFNKPPIKKIGSRFRKHPFKDGNLTVTLSNYDIIKNEKKISKWITSVQFGNGEGFPIYNYPNEYYKKLVPIIEGLKNGKQFLEIINNGFTEKIGNKRNLQEMYELQKSKDGLLEPTELIEEVTRIIEKIGLKQEMFFQNGKNVFKNKEVVPAKQLFALYAINKISTIANRK